jgi:DNA-directed RNA polymerase subunit RPC12/RpoP
MALINCDECGHQVSDQAFKCPNCGSAVLLMEKVQRFISWGWKVALSVIGGLVLVGMAFFFLIRSLN